MKVAASVSQHATQLLHAQGVCECVYSAQLTWWGHQAAAAHVLQEVVSAGAAHDAGSTTQSQGYSGSLQQTKQAGEGLVTVLPTHTLLGVGTPTPRLPEDHNLPCEVANPAVGQQQQCLSKVLFEQYSA